MLWTRLASPILVVALARPIVRTNRPIRAFCSAKTCSTCARTADFFAFARAVRAGIGRSAGFFRWMRLTNMRSCSSSSFFFER